MAILINSSKSLGSLCKFVPFGPSISIRLSRNYSNPPNPVKNRLADKVAVITASTAGIALSAAERMLSEGAKVVISSRKQENVAAALEFLNQKGWTDVFGVQCHVALAEDRQQLFETALKQFGKIDVFVSNAAVNPTSGSILNCSEKAWDKIFEVNVKSTFLLAKEVISIMQRQKTGGSIILMSSYAGLNPWPNIGAYSVSKTALFGLTKALSQDVAADNIRVNCIAPGVIKTKFGLPLYENEEARNQLLAQVPMKRLGEPENIAGIIAFLASDDSAYMTGETIVAAGGMVSRL